MPEIDAATLPPDPPLAAEMADDITADMANLTAAQTGIDGTIFISTAMGGHGPRVKYFLQPGRARPSFSVSIAERPIVVASGLPAGVVRRMSPRVVAWVSLNSDPLWISGIAATLGRSPRSTSSFRNCAGFKDCR